MIARGSNNLAAVRRGNTECTAVYRGAQQVWSAGAPPFNRQALIDAFKVRVAADGGTFEAEAAMLSTLNDISDASLTNAKLLLTPNAFKAGKLYSAIGEDFAVSRASGRSRITSALGLQYLANHVPGIDYTVGGLPAVLVEPQRTNLLADPIDFGSANWQRLRITATADAIAAPDGTTTAERLIETAETNSKLLIQVRNFTSGLPYSVTGFVKKGVGSAAPAWVQMLLASATFGSVQYGAFNLDTNAFATFGGASASLLPLANGWLRTGLTATATSGGSGNQTLYAFGNNASSPRLPAYTGNTNADMYAWGAQMEQAATPTSFIPHTNAGGVREADAVTVNVPAGATQIIQTVDGVTTTITSFGATYTLPQGWVSRVLML